MTASATPSKESGSSKPIGKALVNNTEPPPAKNGSDHKGDEAAALRSESPGHEEPALALEPDLPSDGRDVEGESMIRDLPQRTGRADPTDSSR